MKNKLHAFGDSFTYGHELSDCPGNDHYKCSDLTYSALLAKNLNYEYNCHAIGASSNKAITRILLEEFGNNQISNNDFVTLMWTYVDRDEFLLNTIGYESITIQDVPSNINFKNEYYKTVDMNEQERCRLSAHEILVAQTTLKHYNVDYYMFFNNRMLSEFIRTSDSTIVKLLDKSKMFFVPLKEWSVQKKLPQGKSHHPLDEAHLKFFKMFNIYWKKNNEQT